MLKTWIRSFVERLVEYAKDAIDDTGKRVLPSWASSSSSSNDKGSRGSTKRPRPSGENPRGVNGNTGGNVKRIKVTVNHGTKTDDHLLNKNAKRILPSYLQPSPLSSFRPTSPVKDKANSSQMHEKFGNPYNSSRPPSPTSSFRLSSPVKNVGSSSQMHEKYGNSYSSSRSENDVAMRNNNRSRVSPPWMKSPMPGPAAPFGGQSDPSQPAVVQETHCDERQIYQVALQDLNQPVIEATVPKGLLSVPLHRHQKIALAWMLQKENSVLACSGGILADDQGLGKTISVISLIQMQRFSSQRKLRDSRVSEAEALDLESDEPLLITGSGSKREFIVSEAEVLDLESHEPMLITRSGSKRKLRVSEKAEALDLKSDETMLITGSGSKREFRVSEAEALDLESDEPMCITGSGSKREFRLSEAEALDLESDEPMLITGSGSNREFRVSEAQALDLESDEPMLITGSGSKWGFRVSEAEALDLESDEPMLITGSGSKREFRVSEAEALDLESDEPMFHPGSRSKREFRLSEAEALDLESDEPMLITSLGSKQEFRVSEAEALDLESDEPMLITGSGSKREFQNQKPLGGSLIVCPASILRQWARELDEKVSDEAKLEVLIYHGPNRTKDPAELAQYDVVLTTYAIVAKEVPTRTANKDDDAKDDDREHKKRKVSNVSKKKKNGTKGIIDYNGTLSKVHWFRVILDEAQTIKNHSTRVSKSCCGLRAKKRWCLSGTPIQNSIDELFSYFRFLKCEPYSNYTSFCNQIKNPISRSSSSSQGYKKLQAVLKTIMIRRTKDTLIDGRPIITLPPKTIKLSSVDFSTEERDFYLKLEENSCSQFKAYAAAGTVNHNYANILVLLLRLRQACDHPLLVKGLNSESSSQVSTKMAKNLPREMQVNLLNILETLSICHLCSDPPEDAAVTLCGHVFCYQCVSEYLTGDDNTCPSPNCNSQIGGDAIFTKSTLLSCTSNGYDDYHNSSSAEDKPLVLNNDKSLVLHNVRSSSKIKAALEIIESNCGSNDPIKTIVFSQWTRMLDLVQMELNQHYIEYRRLDGSMSLASRDRAVKEFNTDPKVSVMLMSLKAGNLGLNMVSASHVILLDLWWNPATEDQAVDRAHRIGQTRPVTVSRLTIKDTVEDRILALQEKKRKMVASAFGEDQGGSSRLTAEDLKFLFMGSY